MILSGLKIYNGLGEVSVQSEARIERFDTGTLTTTFSAIPTGENIYWSVCGVNVNTLGLVDSDLQNIKYWFSKKWEWDSEKRQPYQAEYPIANIDVVSGTYMSFYLQPSVVSTVDHLGITPYVSGGTSIEVFVSGSDNYWLGGRRLSISNQLDDGSYNVLSGFWIGKDGTSGHEVSGIINYETGQMQLDFTHLPAASSPSDIFETNYKTLYVKYEGNYGDKLVTRETTHTITNKYASAARLNLHALNDTESYYISVSTFNMLALPSEGGRYDEYYFHPSRINILDSNYNYGTVTLSAVYKQRNDYHKLGRGIYNNGNWPYNTSNGRAIVWKCDNPNLVACAVNAGYGLSAFPISGWSNYIDTIVLSSNLLSAQTFKISACFPDDTLNQRTTAIYTFNYDPIVTEDLKINVLSSTETAEIIKVFRQVNTPANIYYSDVNHAITWKLDTTSTATLCALTGIVPDSLDNAKYLRAQVWDITGNVGLVCAVPLTSWAGPVTGYDNVYGVDYLLLSSGNPDVSFTISVSYLGDPFVGSISAIDTHTFQMYSSTTNLIISAIAFDNAPFTRSLTAKALNEKGVNYIVPLHPLNKVIWTLTEPDSGNSAVTALKVDGSSYSFNTYGDDTLVLKIQTDTFDMDSTFPVLCSFVLNASVYDTFHSPITYMDEASHNFDVDTFPSTDIFDSYMKLNFEDSKSTTGMWRLTSTNYSLTAEDVTTISGTSIISGTRLWDFDDGRTATFQISTVSFGVITPDILTIRLSRNGVSASGWISAHKIESNIDLHFISNFLSADFVVYPTYVFVNSSTQIANTIFDTVTSFGVSAYDVGHTETFVFSAFNLMAFGNYVWSVGGQSTGDSSSVIFYPHSNVTDSSGLPIKLEMYNDEMSFPMPDTYKEDVSGTVVAYPNKKTTDNSNVLFEHLKMFAYESPTLYVDTYSNNLLMPIDNEITATSHIEFPLDIPAVEDVGISYWTLSTSKWEVNSNNGIFDTIIRLGSDDSVAGVIKYEATYPLILVLTRRSYTAIPNTFPPYDWGTQEQITTTSVNISYSALPELLFVPIIRYGVVNSTITFYNETNFTPLISGFYVNDGYQTSSTFISGFADFETSYPVEGVYSIGISGLATDGRIYTNTMPNAITIVSAFQSFNPDVERIFGATVLELPHSFEDIRIPPNEWATSDNFNRSINLLRDNLAYMRNMTQFYNLPPTSFFGWLGSIDDQTFKWFYNNISDYQGLSAVQSNTVLSAVNDFKYRNNYTYIADGNNVRVMNSKITPTTLNIITNKTIDDSIGFAKAIGIDSQNRIYVLDKPKNRVLVYAPYSNIDPNSNRFMFEWGKIGGPNAKYGFSLPNDMLVDVDDSVWVADTGNKAIKKYTRTGSWLKTIICSEIGGITPEDGGIISLAIDRESNIHVLTKSAVYKYSSNGVYLDKYTHRNIRAEQPQKIIAMNGGGFMYICLETSVVKVMEDGSYAGEFADENENASYTSIQHDANNNFYICNVDNILKYFDMNVITSSREAVADQYLWTQEDTNVHKDENIQDFVCNIVFKRMWDNVELFRRSLKGQIQYTTDSLGNDVIEIVGYNPTAYQRMYPIDKADIYIGINELVTADVINRCLGQLQTSMENIVNNI